MAECDTCADPTIPGSQDGAPKGECPKSERACGHHCNCSWVHDCCHWCGVEFGEDGAESTTGFEAANTEQSGRTES